MDTHPIYQKYYVGLMSQWPSCRLTHSGNKLQGNCCVHDEGYVTDTQTSRIVMMCLPSCQVTANRHLETYAPDTGAGMSLIHFLVSFSLHISVICVTFARPHLTSCRMTLIRRLEETKKCIKDMPAPVSGAYVSRCLLVVRSSWFSA